MKINSKTGMIVFGACCLVVALEGYRAFTSLHSPHHVRVVRRAVSLCSKAQVHDIVRAQVLGWDPPQHISMPQYGSRFPFSVLHLAVKEAFRGTLSGNVDVLVYMGIDEDGSSAEGDFGGDGGPVEGVFMIERPSNRLALAGGGFFRYDGSRFVSESGGDKFDVGGLVAAIQSAGSSPDCDDPYYARNGDTSIPVPHERSYDEIVATQPDAFGGSTGGTGTTGATE